MRVLERLRSAVARLVEALPGGVERAIDLRRSLDLDAALGWQLHTLATASDVLRCGRVVPKAGAMERFISAARSRGLPEALAREVEEAYAEFESAVTEHAGDRETFDAILSAMRPQDGAALQRIRRAAFKANAAVWGVSVRCTLNCVVFYERPTGEHDCLSIRGRVGLRRLHEGAVVGMYASGRTWGGSTSPPEGEAGVAVDMCELLEEYCSTPTPRIDRVEMPDGNACDFLQLEGLGRTSEVTLFWRNLSLNFPGGSRTPPHGCTSPVAESTETMVMDLLVPRGWCDPRTAGVMITPEPSRYTAPSSPAGPSQLPFEGKVEHLGSRLENLYTRYAPRYVEAVTRELAALGWAGTAFDIHRCVVRYPVLHSAVHIFVDGPR